MMKARNIFGIGMITGKQARVLQQLKNGADNDWPFADLAHIHMATIKALTSRYLIFASDGMDGMRYRITGTGIKALHGFNIPVEPRRYDGMCSICGKQPRAAYSSSYCRDCGNTKRRKSGQMVGYQQKSIKSMKCPRCAKRKRHVEPSGKVRSYCLVCRREWEKPKRIAKHQKKLELIAAGELLICCKCDQPVHHTERSVYDYCRVHLREYMNAYNRRRRAT